MQCGAPLHLLILKDLHCNTAAVHKHLKHNIPEQSVKSDGKTTPSVLLFFPCKHVIVLNYQQAEGENKMFPEFISLFPHVAIFLKATQCIANLSSSDY